MSFIVGDIVAPLQGGTSAYVACPGHEESGWFVLADDLEKCVNVRPALKAGWSLVCHMKPSTLELLQGAPCC